MNADGMEPVNLTQSESDELFPAVSPDGQEIAFVKPIDDNYDIYVLDILENSTKRLTWHSAVDDWPSWYDGGEKIVFDSERTGTWGIYMMNTDGSDITLLVDTPGRDTDPYATPGSAWVLYTSERIDGRQLFAYDPRRDQELQLTHNNRTNGPPALSADGKTIVYSSGSDFWHLYTISIEGGDEHQLTNGEYDDRWAVWSPNGSTIAFQSNRDGQWEIYLLRPDSMVQTRLSRGTRSLPN